jgi:hypothetical protein
MKPITQTIVDDQGTIIYLVLYAKDSHTTAPVALIRQIAEMLSRQMVSASQTSLYGLKN